MARRLGPSGLRSKMASSSSTSTDSTPSTSSTPSAVPRASISRERVPKSNTGKYKERGNSDPKNMSLRDRIEEFPEENLCLRGGKLFCNGCKEILSSKKSILKNHFASKKHAAGKEKLKVTKKRDQTIEEALRKEKHNKDSTLPVEERAYRLQVVEEFLKAGIPIRKMDKLRTLLERQGYRLSHSSNMMDYVTIIYKQEIERIKAEIRQGVSTRDVSVIYDGSTRQGEAIVILVRFVDDDWNIVQRLIRIDICAKAVNGDQLAQVLNECLSIEYGVRGESLIAAMRDGASVNQAALNRIQFIFPKTFNVVCFSHTLDNVGNHFVIPNLTEFGNLWIRLFSQSHKAGLMWKELTGRKPKSYSETRWWSRWEVYKQLMEQFGDVQRFIDDMVREKVAPQTSRQLADFFADLNKVISLKLELAALIDVGEVFVKATYVLEGDGPLVLSCFETLQGVCNACQNVHLPNVHAVAVAIVDADPAQNVAALEQEAKRSVQPAIEWFLRKFNVELHDTLSTFKAARIMCPVTVQWLRPTPANVEALRQFPFLDSNDVINDLVTEMPNYLAAAQDVIMACEEDKVKWWRQQSDNLPHWSSAVMKVLLVQPSSAAAERVFSILNSSFNDSQEHALVDYLQACVMLQYNNR